MHFYMYASKWCAQKLVIMQDFLLTTYKNYVNYCFRAFIVFYSILGILVPFLVKAKPPKESSWIRLLQMATMFRFNHEYTHHTTF